MRDSVKLTGEIRDWFDKNTSEIESSWQTYTRLTQRLSQTDRTFKRLLWKTESNWQNTCVRMKWLRTQYAYEDDLTQQYTGPWARTITNKTPSLVACLERARVRLDWPESRKPNGKYRSIDRADKMHSTGGWPENRKVNIERERKQSTQYRPDNRTVNVVRVTYPNLHWSQF